MRAPRWRRRCAPARRPTSSSKPAAATAPSCCCAPAATTVADRTLWTLQDITELQRLAKQAARQAELLDMAQEFGRLGVWERDIPSGEGRWDRHVFGFWGLDREPGTPRYDEADPAASIPTTAS